MTNPFEHVKCFLLDMDGTFYLGNRLIKGSLEFVDAVKRSGRDFLFLTNNSSRSAKHYVKKLAGMGLCVDLSKVLTSGQATGQWALREQAGKRAYVLGNSYLIGELFEMGVPMDERDPEYMIVGYDTTLDYPKMTKACDLARAGLPIVATHPDLNCPTETGFAPDIGAILAFIKASTGREPDVVVGKPHSGIVEAAALRTGCPLPQMAMVGDRLYTDIETGLRHGITSVLVMTGETTPQMREESATKADLVFERLSEMIPFL